MSKQRHFLYISVDMFISEQLSEMKDTLLCTNFLSAYVDKNNLRQRYFLPSVGAILAI